MERTENMNHRSRSPFSLAGRSPMLLAICLVTFASAVAQSSTATLTGTVEDQNGAVVPGVSVTVQNVGTSAERQATTNDSGSFTVPLLLPGTYTITARRDGFTPLEIRNVTLNVGDQKTLIIQLKVGQVGATLQVTTEAPLISESTGVGTVVDSQFLRNIPVNGRSGQTLIQLTPGVVAVPSSAPLSA